MRDLYLTSYHGARGDEAIRQNPRGSSIVHGGITSKESKQKKKRWEDCQRVWEIRLLGIDVERIRGQEGKWEAKGMMKTPSDQGSNETFSKCRGVGSSVWGLPSLYFFSLCVCVPVCLYL